MARNPRYKVVTPPEDPREGRPLDDSEYAFHLYQGPDGQAPSAYQNPQKSFERKYLGQNLTGLAAEVIRRLSVKNGGLRGLFGTEFDSLKCRGGHDETPMRKTPWREIAFQPSGEQGWRSLRSTKRRGL